MTFGDLFSVVKSVFNHPLTIIVTIFLVLYIMLVRYVTNYRRKVKVPKKQQKKSKPLYSRQPKPQAPKPEEEEEYDESEYTTA